MKTIVIAGGAGFLGQVLARHFKRKAWRVVVLTRHPEQDLPCGRPVAWDGAALGPWVRQLEGADALVNLCGVTVNCRYHRRNRARIRDSRLVPTELLAKAIANASQPPPVWLNASSGTIYRHSLDAPMTESVGEIGDGFSVEVCRDWENAFFQPSLPRVRRVALRAAMVLGRGRNSVYPTLARLCRMGLGGKMGSGRQMVSWIHETDFARAVERAIDDDRIEGPLNLAAPAPVSNAVFMATLRAAVGAPFALPQPKPLLQLGAWLLRTETELVLKSRFVVPDALLRHRFVFRYAFLDDAFANLAEAEPEAELAPALYR